MAFTPYSVISGFMSGIGIIIILIQILPFLGADAVSGGPLGAVRAWPEAMRDINFNALAIAGVTLAVGLLWPSKLRRYPPATLAALVAGTLLGVLWLTDTPVIGAVPTGLPEIHIPALSLHTLANELQPALTIALLGSIDSLLTSLIADSMTRSRHNANRELAGQGIANTVSGFIGGLPGAGNTVSGFIGGLLDGREHGVEHSRTDAGGRGLGGGSPDRAGIGSWKIC